jgi:hypothetical protein
LSQLHRNTIKSLCCEAFSSACSICWSCGAGAST